MISAKQKRAIKRFVEKSDGELWPILQLLRSEEIGMTNTRRLLDEHPMSRGFKKALEVWGTQWPTRAGGPADYVKKSHPAKLGNADLNS
jgi:hypothetical protein